MFTEYFKSHPHRAGATALPRCPFPPASDRAVWEGLPPARREALRALADRFRAEPYAPLTARQYMALLVKPVFSPVAPG